jgi:hypothetical protein
MRFFEFNYKTAIAESSQKSELISANAIHTANYLSSVTEKLPEEDGQKLIAFNDTLEKIIDGISKFTDYFRSKQSEPVAAPVAKEPVSTQSNTAVAPSTVAPINKPAQPATLPVQEGVKYNRRREYNFPEELAAAKQNIETIKEEIKFLENVATNTPKEKDLRDRGLSFANQQLESATRTFKGFKSAVDERNLFKKQKEEADKFLQDIANFLTVLGDRVQGYTQGLANIDTSGLKSAEKKKIVNAQQFTSTLRQALFGLIIEIANKRETSVTPEQIKGFLQACVDGQVINMSQVVGKDYGNIRDALNPEWKDVFDLFVEKNIFEYSPGTTSGAVGPGEMALSMMANPTEKAPVGDLMINGIMYEVKAGLKTGGRLNSKGIGKATTGWKVWSEKIEEIVRKNAPPQTKFFSNTDNKGNKLEKGTSPKQFSANMVNANTNKNTGRITYKVASKYNWNAKGFNALNEEVLIHSTRPETVDLFMSSLKSIFNNYTAVAKRMEELGVGSPSSLIGGAISRDGKKVSLVKMNQAITAMAFVSYHLEDHIENILFLNTKSLEYSIIRGQGGDPTDLLEKIESGYVKITSGFNWNDAQQTPTPSYNASRPI